MVSAWPEPLSATAAGPPAGVCDGQEALALCTSENAPLTKPGWRADVVRPIPDDPPGDIAK